MSDALFYFSAMSSQNLLDFPPLSFDETPVSDTSVDSVSEELPVSAEGDFFLEWIDDGVLQEVRGNMGVTYVVEVITDKVETITSFWEGSDDEWFFLSPPDEEHLDISTGGKSFDEVISEPSRKRYSEPALPTIDWKIYDEPAPAIEPIKTDLWIPQENLITVPEVSGSILNNNSVSRLLPPVGKNVYSSLESGYAKPYLKKLQEFHARLDTTTLEREISAIAAILFYMTDGMDIFFNYEKKWDDNKEEYMNRANISNGTFLKRLKLLLQRYGFGDSGAGKEDVENVAYKIFLEKIEIFKENFLDEIVFDILPDDTAFVMHKIWSDSKGEGKRKPRFSEAQEEEFRFLFNFYFQQLQVLKREKKRQTKKMLLEQKERMENGLEKVESLGLAREDLILKIEDIETYFDRHVFIFFDEAEDPDFEDPSQVITETAGDIRARLEEKRQGRNNQ